MTLIELVTDVLRQLAIISEIDTPSAEQGQDAVTKYNDLMASLEADGILLGHNPKATTAEDVAIPDGHRAAIKAMLGVSLCEGYGLPPPPVMAAMAKAGYDRLLRIALHTSMPRVVSDAPAGQVHTFNILTGQ